ncbi:MAG: chromosome segregation protein SMC [Elusimicrobiota bacterium]|jgi:chromosome segregation protein|nr:chromosome segregation protein SMC [Elusimicrobiota bacterium]
MYLKKIEIVGFKSFADKTVLDFEKGITGIIGPNGCGKSNIADAIRWCLGEQRARAMRSPKMTDVIFGGAQKRIATGMAEVSLTFDNTNNVLPVAFSEVIITRRVFKDGESQYFINKSPCRLKDIKDTFLDTGIGAEGYSIIEQGKVDFLITAKPEDRRLLFEEAAGVAKYKTRREETLKRLAKVEADMGRLSDALLIHKQQIDALDQQAKKAKQYKKYQDELKKYETVDLIAQIDYGMGEIEKISQALNPKMQEYEISNTTSIEIETEISNLRLIQDDQNTEYISLNTELSDINAQISIADNDNQTASSRQQELEADQERLAAELEANREKVEEFEGELATLGADDGSIVNEVETLKNSYEAKQKEHEDIKTKLDKLTSEISQVRLAAAGLESDKENQLNEKTQILQTKTELDIENASLARMLEKLQNDIAPINSEIEQISLEIEQSQNSLTDNNQKMERLAAEIRDVESSLENTEKEILSLNNLLSSNNSRIETIKEFDKQNPIRRAIKSLLNLGLARGPVSSLIDVKDPANEEIVASALGEKLDYLICKDLTQAQKAIEYLQDNNLSRLSFIIEDKLPAVTPQNKFELSSNAAQLINFLSFNVQNERIVNFICGASIATDGKVYNGPIVSGGAKMSLEKPVLIEEQIKRLNQENEKINLDILNRQSAQDAAAKKLTDLKVEKSNLELECMKISTQIESKKSQIEEKKSEIIGSSQEIEKYNKQIADGQAEALLLNEKISQIDIEIANLSDIDDASSNKEKELDEQISSLRQNEQETSNALMEARSNYDKKSAQLENKQKGRQYINQNLDTLKNQIDYALNLSAQNLQKISELETSQQEYGQTITNLHEQKAIKEELIRFCLDKREQTQTEIDKKNETLIGLKKKVEDLNEEINTLQVDLKNFEYQKGNLLQKLEETCGKSFEEVKKEFGNAEANADEIAKIKRRMEALGPINHAAPEEYDNLQQRYDFLLDQQKDLIKAKGDLTEVIKKINDSTIENFKKTFDKVRENFQALYSKLFNGGQADLKLTDENNLLESGIDIFAQPPGKKLQNISLYSGGEKALTAVALLFAFFMVKASPFCILDEVDAPLDDANIGRYNQMIKEFVKDTQFLVVTHNKRTMEIADVLYGVTMEQQGISKIISVNLNKVTKE